MCIHANSVSCNGFYDTATRQLLSWCKVGWQNKTDDGSRLTRSCSARFCPISHRANWYKTDFCYFREIFIGARITRRHWNSDVLYCPSLYGLNFVMNYFQSIAQIWNATWVTAMREIIFMTIFILPSFFGVYGVWLSVPLAELIVMITAILYVR